MNKKRCSELATLEGDRAGFYAAGLDVLTGGAVSPARTDDEGDCADVNDFTTWVYGPGGEIGRRRVGITASPAVVIINLSRETLYVPERWLCLVRSTSASYAAGAVAVRPTGRTSCPLGRTVPFLPAWKDMVPTIPTIPPRLIASVDTRLAATSASPGARVVSSTRIGGGDINEAAALTTSSGERLFLKWNADAPAGMFAAEADGLEALGAAAGPDLVVPAVIATGSSADGAWLLMDFVGRDGSSSDRSRGDQWAERLGRGLAALHAAEIGDDESPSFGFSDRYGWRRDNFIGRLPQPNGWHDQWSTFWRDRRIVPQVRHAVDAGRIDRAEREGLDRLIERMDDALEGAGADGPSLLHGDLWGGNTMEAGDGRAAIYDPAVYRGHREVDLAMSELFGFPDRFMPAYREASPVDELYDVRRRDLYQLYYLLVHVNLFGRSYVDGTMAATRRVLATL